MGETDTKKKVESITKHKTKPSKVLFAEEQRGSSDEKKEENLPTVSGVVTSKGKKVRD